MELIGRYGIFSHLEKVEGDLLMQLDFLDRFARRM